MGRDDREEKRTVPYLVTNLLVPNIAASKLALIEPDFDAGRSQGVGETSRRLSILRGIAQENGSSRLGHRGVAPRPWLGDLLRSAADLARDRQLIRIRMSVLGVANGLLGVNSGSSLRQVASSQLRTT
jgi:hypothetical protein